MSKQTIIRGTLILTIAGLTTRFIGFFYKIYLSNALGSKLLGVYQLVFPIYGICYTIFASGIQTAISKLIAESNGLDNQCATKRILRVGLALSVSIALFLSVFVYWKSDFLSNRILMESSSKDSLRILSLIFPFCGITACINGYYYGKKKAGIPAATQLLEQIIRVVVVYFIALKLGDGNEKISCELAVFGLIIGEAASTIFNIISIPIINSKMRKCSNTHHSSNTLTNRDTINKLMKISSPLTLNRLLLSLLHSLEAILIPNLLKRSGLSSSEALSVYGILTGMTLPFILFPSTITNSLSVLLLPAISEANAKNQKKYISNTICISIKYSLILGIFSTTIFLFFGDALGLVVFHETRAGSYLKILAWLCPFLYLATTMSSILNGLGKVHITFLNSVISQGVRILIMVAFVPRYGIQGYLLSFLVSQLLLTALDVFLTYRIIAFPFDSINSIVKPAAIAVCSCSFFYQAYFFLQTKTQWNHLLLILMSCLVIAIIYLVFLFLLKVIALHEWK